MCELLRHSLSAIACALSGSLPCFHAPRSIPVPPPWRVFLLLRGEAHCASSIKAHTPVGRPFSLEAMRAWHVAGARPAAQRALLRNDHCRLHVAVCCGRILPIRPDGKEQAGWAVHDGEGLLSHHKPCAPPPSPQPLSAWTSRESPSLQHLSSHSVCAAPEVLRWLVVCAVANSRRAGAQGSSAASHGVGADQKAIEESMLPIPAGCSDGDEFSRQRRLLEQARTQYEVGGQQQHGAWPDRLATIMS